MYLIGHRFNLCECEFIKKTFLSHRGKLTFFSTETFLIVAAVSGRLRLSSSLQQPWTHYLTVTDNEYLHKNLIINHKIHSHYTQYDNVSFPRKFNSREHSMKRIHSPRKMIVDPQHICNFSTITSAYLYHTANMPRILDQWWQLHAVDN